MPSELSVGGMKSKGKRPDSRRQEKKAAKWWAKCKALLTTAVIPSTLLGAWTLEYENIRGTNEVINVDQNSKCKFRNRDFRSVKRVMERGRLRPMKHWVSVLYSRFLGPLTPSYLPSSPF